MRFEKNRTQKYAFLEFFCRSLCRSSERGCTCAFVVSRSGVMHVPGYALHNNWALKTRGIVRHVRVPSCYRRLIKCEPQKRRLCLT